MSNKGPTLRRHVFTDVNEFVRRGIVGDILKIENLMAGEGLGASDWVGYVHTLNMTAFIGGGVQSGIRADVERERTA